MHVVDHVQFVILNCTEITLRSFIFSKSNNNIYTSGDTQYTQNHQVTQTLHTWYLINRSANCHSFSPLHFQTSLFSPVANLPTTFIIFLVSL